MKNNKLKTYRIGHITEHIAALYLRLKFYRIIRRRYKSPVGEIDLLAVKNNTLIAVEVKFRHRPKQSKQTTEHAFETIHIKNQRRVTRALEHFLTHQPRYHAYDLRFDAIVIGWPPAIHHLDNAWQTRA